MAPSTRSRPAPKSASPKRKPNITSSSPAMADASDIKLSQVTIQSQDYEELLDIIDTLRSHGVSHGLDLPQIVVYGDQSSGKSSALERISGLSFPVHDNTCTRFATELILRRAPGESCSVKIRPDPERPGNEKARLSNFKPAAKAVAEDFAGVVNEAGRIMGLGDGDEFSNDVLQIECSGPTQAHLTLVDLPGLIHTSTTTQKAANAENVKKMVRKYMRKKRSIILLVITAKNDFDNQIVTEYAKKYDPSGERTLGIITKPDTLNAGSDMEKSFLEIAQNKKLQLDLGWHVLKNRGYANRDCTREECDAAGEEFFSTSIWNQLEKAQRGSYALRTRLSEVLKDQIVAKLPALMREIDMGIKDSTNTLEKLGAPRATIREQSMHLAKISQNFTDIVKDAVNGTYDSNSFFQDSDASPERYLRAVVNNLLDDFAATMHIRGHQYQVSSVRTPEIGLGQETSGTRSRPALPGPRLGQVPIKVSKEVRLTKVRAMMKKTRGKEIPGTFNPSIVGELFREQCRPWSSIIKTYADKVYTAVKVFINAAVTHTADERTAMGINKVIINSELETIAMPFTEQTQRLFESHNSHQITFNNYITDNLQKARQERDKKFLADKLQKFFGRNPLGEDHIITGRDVDLKGLLEQLSNRSLTDMQNYAASEALDSMHAYYQVDLKSIIDDFCRPAVEVCLMQPLTSLFPPMKVDALGDDEIQDIAAETDENKEQRVQSSARLEILKAASDALDRLDRSKRRRLAQDDDPVEDSDAMESSKENSGDGSGEEEESADE